MLALALGSCKHKSLTDVVLINNGIEDGDMANIIDALNMHPVKRLILKGTGLAKNGCAALATLLQCSTTELWYLCISNNDIDDEGIEALVPALANNCNHLKYLCINASESITTKGWQRIATILESPTCKLEQFEATGKAYNDDWELPWLQIQNNIDDDAAAAFASSLVNNHTLRELKLNGNPLITANGWQDFSNVLCNTTSVNKTFLSNHTLTELLVRAPPLLQPYLSLNYDSDKKEVATIKILQHHYDVDMQPFFEWEFKCLPMVVGWLERASSIRMQRGFEPNIERRKLSCIYQFVRSMPDLYVEMYTKNN